MVMYGVAGVVLETGAVFCPKSGFVDVPEVKGKFV